MANHHVRWGIRRDIPRILATEAGLPDAWAEDDYLIALRRRHTICMVAEDWRSDTILGVMIYRLFDTHLKLLRLVVNPACRRQGVGQSLVAKLVYKVCSHRRESVYACVPGGNLSVQLFLRSCAFRATAVLPPTTEAGENCYLMEMRPDDAVYESFGTARPVNRVATYYEEK